MGGDVDVVLGMLVDEVIVGIVDRRAVGCRDCTSVGTVLGSTLGIVETAEEGRTEGPTENADTEVGTREIGLLVGTALDEEPIRGGLEALVVGIADLFDKLGMVEGARLIIGVGGTLKVVETEDGAEELVLLIGKGVEGPPMLGTPIYEEIN